MRQYQRIMGCEFNCVDQIDHLFKLKMTLSLIKDVRHSNTTVQPKQNMQDFHLAFLSFIFFLVHYNDFYKMFIVAFVIKLY